MYSAQIAATAFANELIALGVGVALIAWAGQSKKLAFTKAAGYFIAVLSFVALIYTSYFASASAVDSTRPLTSWFMSKAKACESKVLPNGKNGTTNGTKAAH